VVLSFLALNFYKMIYTKEAHELKMKQQVDETIAAVQEGESGEATAFGKKHAFLIFSFTTGLREGLESVIFLVGVISDFKDPSYVSSLPIPIITALILSRIVGCIFFQGTKKMKVEHFMRFCSIFLLFIAAGFFTSSMHKWQELELFGTWSPRADRPWQNVNVWDATDCCNDKTNRFWVLMRALLGWQDMPTPMEFFAYAFYWLFILALGFFVVRHAKKQMAAHMAKLRRDKGVPEEESENVAVKEEAEVKQDESAPVETQV
jgi:high-affinity iron transporter